MMIKKWDRLVECSSSAMEPEWWRHRKRLASWRLCRVRPIPAGTAAERRRSAARRGRPVRRWPPSPVCRHCRATAPNSQQKTPGWQRPTRAAPWCSLVFVCATIKRHPSAVPIIRTGNAINWRPRWRHQLDWLAFKRTKVNGLLVDFIKS